MIGNLVRLALPSVLAVVFTLLPGFPQVGYGQQSGEEATDFAAPGLFQRLPPIAPNLQPAEEIKTPEPEPEGEDTGEVVVEEVEEEFFPLWKKWGGSVELGLSGTEGNTQTNNIQLGAKLKRETPFDIHTWELTHIDKSNDGVKTALSTILDGRIEWPIPDTPWTYYIHGLGEYDEFKAFDVRLSADTGLGYQFIKSELVDLIGRIGVSTSREFGGPTERYVPELSSGLEWRRKFSDRHNISAKVEYFPDVTDVTEYRLNGTASWEIVVAPDWGLSLKLNAINRFDSTPAGARRNDLNYSALLLWSF